MEEIHGDKKSLHQRDARRELEERTKTGTMVADYAGIYGNRRSESGILEAYAVSLLVSQAIRTSENGLYRIYCRNE